MKFISKTLCLYLLVLISVTSGLSNNSSVEVKLNGTQIIAALSSNPIHHIVGRVVDFFRQLVNEARSKHKVDINHRNVTENSVSTFDLIISISFKRYLQTRAKRKRSLWIQNMASSLRQGNI